MSRVSVLVVTMIILCLGLAPEASGGSVQGTVVFDDAPPRLPTLDMAADPACQAKHKGSVQARILELGPGKTMGNVFVQVKNAPPANRPVPKEPVIIDQVGCLYQPRVVGVMAGQPLLFRNSDRLMHTVRSQSTTNRPFNLGMPPMIPEDVVTLNKPEPIFPVKCDIHPWMQAYVAVMSHPYFDVTGTDGKFSIDGLPAGTYTIEAWHERLGTQSQRVTVPASGAVTADFSFQTPK